MKTAIGIDVGGTNIKGIILTADGEILKQHFVPTNDDGEGKWRETVQDVVRYLKKSHNEPIELIGLSCPGFADETNSCISYMPGRLSGVEHFQWEACFGTKTYVINDAHAALIAEATFGEIRGYKNAILLTLGTGVGGGLLINGELYQGLSQMAGHFGHLSITPHDDELSLLGMPGSLEYALGNYSIHRRSSGRFSTTHELVQGYLKNDPFASWLWLDSMRKLSLTLASFSNVLSPEIIVLAGGITSADSALFTPLNAFLDVYEFKPNNKKKLIKRARFSELAGAVGAAAFAFGKVVSNPLSVFR